MNRKKFVTRIRMVIFCSLLCLLLRVDYRVFAYESVTDMETPTGLPVFEEEAEAADEEDYECIEEDEAAQQSLFRMADISADDWGKYGSHYFYNQLSAEEREYWDSLDTVCEKYLTTETDAAMANSGAYRMKAISGSDLTKEQQKNVLLMFRYSNPQYYFLNPTVYIIKYSNGKVSVIFGIYPAFGKGTDRMEETAKVKEQVDIWQEQIDTCSTDFEKVQKIHDLICEKVYYNQALVNNNFSTESTEYSQSVYSVFCMDKTVCAGYAQSFAMMCNSSGIDAVSVTSSNHEWNKVKICSAWYNVDCTWDDQSNGFYYSYFVRSDEFYDTYSSWSKSCHTEETYWDGYLPVCTLDSGATMMDPGKLPIEGHTAVTDAAVAAACETTGLTEGSHCSVCGKVLTEQTVVPATGHTAVTDAAVAATCATTGLTEGSHCSVCEKVLTEQTVVPATGRHTPAADAAAAAACETTGLTEGSHCSVCGKVLTEQTVVPATGHTAVTDAAAAAACETTGLTEGSHCSVCGKVLTEQTVIPAAGHKWSEYRESGKVKRKCSVCGKTETVRTLPKVKTVQLSKTSYTYDGKSHMPAVKVTNSAGKKLKEGTDYKIKKPSGRKNAGIYTVTIEMKGDYTGKYRKTFQIIPKGTTISGVKAKKKAFSVYWKKQAKQTSGYQIQYAVDAKFKKSVVTKNVNNTKKVKLDVSKLKAKKKYYIRVRTYKTVKVNGKSKKIYSGWSKVKAVTTKK